MSDEQVTIDRKTLDDLKEQNEIMKRKIIEVTSGNCEASAWCDDSNDDKLESIQKQISEQYKLLLSFQEKFKPKHNFSPQNMNYSQVAPIIISEDNRPYFEDYKHSPQQFFDQLDEYFVSMGTMEHQKVRILQGQLDGIARDWCVDARKSMNNYESIKHYILENLKQQSEIMTPSYNIQWNRLTKGLNESYAAFVNRLINRFTEEYRVPNELDLKNIYNRLKELMPPDTKTSSIKLIGILSGMTGRAPDVNHMAAIADYVE